MIEIIVFTFIYYTMQTKKSSSLSVTVVRNESPYIQPLGPPGSRGSRSAISVIYAAAVLGMKAEIVQVETHLTSGMVRFFFGRLAI